MSSGCCSGEEKAVEEMKALFEPRGIAVIGASANPAKIGYRIVENVLASGYAGKVFPINPKGGEILGKTAYPSLTDVEGEVDVAVIAIPSDHVFSAVEACARKSVRHLVIITSGFSEVGNTEQERRIVEFAREHGMRVLGPNIFGIYSAASSLDATFGPGNILPGHVAIVTQDLYHLGLRQQLLRPASVGLEVIGVGRVAQDLPPVLDGHRVVVGVDDGSAGGDGGMEVIHRRQAGGKVYDGVEASLLRQRAGHILQAPAE